jgi:pseudaminic acid cytidylyltransferase
MKIAVIPARGGSKRIPRKNILSFCGKPIIAWSIRAAKSSGLFDRVIVSTDDAEIADVARLWGAETPFVRPPELSDDYVETAAVISHATKWALEQNLKLEAVCCIYATAPLIRAEDLRVGLNALRSGNWDFAFSVTEFAAPIFRALKESTNGGIEMFFPDYLATRSQDLPVAFHDAGQFYWGRPRAWTEGKKIFQQNSVPVKLPRWRVQDIDNWDDWLRAELLFNQLENIKDGD